MGGQRLFIQMPAADPSTPYSFTEKIEKNSFLANLRGLFATEGF